MRIYAIWNVNSMESLPTFFARREQAESVIESFGSVSIYYEVREFEEVRA